MILQVNIKIIKNKLEELKLLIHDTHVRKGHSNSNTVCVETVVGPLHHSSVEGWGRQQQQHIITIQESKLTPKTSTPKVHNFTIVRADRLHKAGVGIVTFIRDNITFTTTDIPSTINTHNFQMVNVHINVCKFILPGCGVLAQI